MQKGGTAAFTALVEAMMAKDRVAIAAYVGGVDRNNAVRCCALVPAITPAAAAGDADTANGLHVIFLPFLDDIRHPEVGSST